MKPFTTIHTSKPVPPVSTIFINGHIAPDIPSIIGYNEPLMEIVMAAIAPIKTYLLQYEDLTEGGDIDLISILHALEEGARLKIKTAIDGIETQTGKIYIHATSIDDKILAVEFKP